MKYQWRITKYDPAFRNEYGHYILDEWTCPSEIGKLINGELFTYEKYLLVEDAYIETIIEFLKGSKVYTLRAILVTNVLISEEDKASLLFEPEFSTIRIEEDMLYNIVEIRIICKMILRNYAGCQLFSKDYFFVHFGWDYYMYIGSCQNLFYAINFAASKGLFVEECTSPYSFEESDTRRMIQWNEVGAEVAIVIGEEEIVNVSMQEYQQLFDLSEEHPVIGYFQITEEHKDFFQSKITHKLDFIKFEYGLWAGY